MICSKCGKEFANDAKFCLFCGQPVGAAPAPAAPVAPAPAQIPQPVQQYAQPVQQYAQPQQVPQYQQPVQQYAQPVQQYAQPNYAPVQAQYNPAGFAPVGEQAKKFDIKKADTIIILASCVLLLVSLFLKFFSLKKKVSFVKVASTLLKIPAGYIYLVNIALILVFLFIGLKKGVFIVSLLNMFLCTIIILVNESSISEDKLSKYIERGPGYFLSLIASIILLVGGIMILIRAKKEKKSYPVPQYGVPTM